ncbi:hypothetical protein L195_g043643 [Trifolium pratense]|uniref:Uncharacterized protein n=1 Tax=Trifolium pratense TaxID=57577 RepID=A0A2K3M9U5_TRIPR|nr:hypothetical protein L195_g043643 [Trifolium pratense]
MAQKVCAWRNSRKQKLENFCSLRHGAEGLHHGAIRRIEDKVSLWRLRHGAVGLRRGAIRSFRSYTFPVGCAMAQKGCAWRKIIIAKLRSGARAAPWRSCVIYLRKTEYVVFWFGILEEKLNLKLWIYDFRPVSSAILAGKMDLKRSSPSLLDWMLRMSH